MNLLIAFVLGMPFAKEPAPTLAKPTLTFLIGTFEGKPTSDATYRWTGRSLGTEHVEITSVTTVKGSKAAQTDVLDLTLGSDGKLKGSTHGVERHMSVTGDTRDGKLYFKSWTGDPEKDKYSPLNTLTPTTNGYDMNIEFAGKTYTTHFVRVKTK